MNVIDYSIIIVWGLTLNDDPAPEPEPEPEVPGEFEDNPAIKGQLFLLIFPDFLFQFPYLILFWVLAKTFVEGHLNLAEDFYIPTIT